MFGDGVVVMSVDSNDVCGDGVVMSVERYDWWSDGTWMSSFKRIAKGWNENYRSRGERQSKKDGGRFWDLMQKKVKKTVKFRLI